MGIAIVCMVKSSPTLLNSTSAVVTEAEECAPQPITNSSFGISADVSVFAMSS